MTTFVLVHGAWVGEWCFDPIIPLLEEKGHTAHAVSLTGYGNKRHLYSDDLTILDHIQDVVTFVKSQGLNGVTLVGHSYGGGIITGAWDQLRENVQELFYLDAGTPEDSESHYDQMLRFDSKGRIKSSFDEALATGIKARLFPVEALRKRNPEKADYMQDKVMPFPLTCVTTPIRFKHGPLPDDTPKSFVLCKKNSSYHHNKTEKFKADKNWDYYELDTYHDCMWEDPQGLVEILVGKESKY